MNDFFHALCITLLFYVFLVYSYYGLGRFILSLLKVRESQKHNLFLLIWIGWAFSLLLFQVINLFLPINLSYCNACFFGGYGNFKSPN